MIDAGPAASPPAAERRITLLPRSLAFRVIAFSTLWAVLALVVIATVVTALFRGASERGFDSLLQANMFNLISAVEATPEGELQGVPRLGDPRYDLENSGWYWAVDAASDKLTGKMRSPALSTEIAGAPSVPFDDTYQKRYTAVGPGGETVAVLEAEVVLESADRIARFRVTGNLDDVEAEISSFNRSIYAYLALFGLGMIAINAVAILLGLRPLGRVRDALAEVRQGTAKRLDGTFPSEIEPLANETNALIDNNRRILERSRTQVGNLAHSLKTPLAVLINEGRSIGGDKGRLIGDQASAMKLQIDHYLQRARVAAQRESVVFRTPAVASVERIVRVMAKLNPKTRIDLEKPPLEIVFAGEREDLEEIAGNLLENAMKWAKGRVGVTVSEAAAHPDRFAFTIDDDGPGIPEDKAREALKRGRRLDETKPGTGLGLAIVSDLVGEYGGVLKLERSPFGGLRVLVELPRAT